MVAFLPMIETTNRDAFKKNVQALVGQKLNHAA
jgi:hypothetical protein